MADHAGVSETDDKEAAARLRPFLEARPSGIVAGMFPVAMPGPIGVFVMFFMIGVALVSVILPSLFFAFVCRGGFLIHTLGIAIVTKEGVRASRLRTLWRSSIAWSPILFLPVVLIVAKSYADAYFPGGKVSLVYSLPIVYALLVIWSSLLPNRSLQDRLAGTYLVPK